MLAIVCALVLLLLIWTLGDVLINGETTHRLTKLFLLRRDAATRLAGEIALVSGVALLLAPRVRRVARETAASPIGFFTVAAFVAAALCLGPTMYANGRAVGPGLYDVLYRWVPGFDGLRVPSLNSMIASVFLSALAGLGASALIGRWRRAGSFVVGVGMLAILAESWSVPTDTNVRFSRRGFRVAISDDRPRRSSATGLPADSGSAGEGRADRVSIRRSGQRDSLRVPFRLPPEADRQRLLGLLSGELPAGAGITLQCPDKR